MPMRTTDPTRRRYGVALLVGLIAGLVSAIVKFGWEVPFPPRTPERDATNPPQALWMWVIEIFRRDLRNRITHQPDPWVPLPADR